jgi:hypothetical protein
MSTTTNRRRVIAAVAALAGVSAGAFLSNDDASAGRLVTGKQIADSSLTGKDLRNGTVSSRDIRDGSLTPSDVDMPTEVAILKLREQRANEPVDEPGLYYGPDGPQGPVGPVGAAGPTGHPGVHGLFNLTSTVTVGAQSYGAVTTSCTSGTKAIAGGVKVNGVAHEVPLLFSAPLDAGAGWSSGVRNESNGDAIVHGWVTCATAG